MSAEVWYYPETDEWKIKNVDKADGSSPTVNHNHVPDTWERIIEDARAYSMNISGNYLWKTSLMNWSHVARHWQVMRTSAILSGLWRKMDRPTIRAQNADL